MSKDSFSFTLWPNATYLSCIYGTNSSLCNLSLLKQHEHNEGEEVEEDEQVQCLPHRQQVQN